jgi:tetratricopeptide (TPR) repeat protein
MDPQDPEVTIIRMRFLVARVVQGLVEDELSVDPDVVDRQVDRVRRELDGPDGEALERGVWERVLLASVALDLEELSAAVLEWGRIVVDSGHVHGGEEILRMAFELARLSGLSLQALDAARFLGKSQRAGARWEEALAWYGVAEGIADDLGDTRKKALVLDGLGNTFRDRGNLPKARETLQEVLEIGRSTKDRYVRAVGHHDLMTVEKLSGNLVSAIHHGWQAVQSYDSNEGSLRALFDLCGVLREAGELRAARDGYSVVADEVAGFEYRVLALDALALIAAKEGDLSAYHSVRSRMEQHRWRELPPVYLGQVLFFRGLANRALGLEDKEREWLQEALAYAERHGLNKIIFDVERSLSEISERAEAPASPLGKPEPFGESISGVRSGLRELRRAAVR